MYDTAGTQLFRCFKGLNWTWSLWQVKLNAYKCHAKLNVAEQDRLGWWTANITWAGRETADYEFIKWKFNELNEITIWEPPISLLQLIICAHYLSLWWENERSLYRSGISWSDAQSWILIEFIDNRKKRQMIWEGKIERLWISFSLSSCAYTALSFYLSLSYHPIGNVSFQINGSRFTAHMLHLCCVTRLGIHLFSEHVQSQLTSERIVQHLKKKKKRTANALTVYD